MSTVIVSGHLDLSSLTQTEEDTLAGTLSGLPAWSSTIWNSTRAEKRYWNGSAFATINGYIFSVKITTGNQTTTSNIAGNITDLIFPATANSVYTVDGVFHIGCNNTGGVKFAITLPTGSTIWMMVDGTTTANTAFIRQAITASATLTGTAVNQENAQRTVRLSGTITIGSTAGNVQFQFASGTDTQTSTIYQEGTFLRIQNVA